jgi:NADPH:quinone reductase-like Zn-dependent oxidoreductase
VVDLSAQPAGTVTVAIEAVGLNFADVWTVLGFYKAAPKECVPGLEFAGRVVAVAPSLPSREMNQNLRVGEKVFGFTRFGAFSTHVTVDERFVRPLPKGWTMEEGASFLVQGLTAWHGLQLADLGDRCEERASAEGSRTDGSGNEISSGELPPVVCVHSAAGGVGLAAWKICRRLGARVIGTVGSEAKKQWLLQHLADDPPAPEQIVVRSGKKAAFEAKLLSEAALWSAHRWRSEKGVASGGSSGGGDGGGDDHHGSDGKLDIVLDGIGGSVFEASLSVLAKGGRVVHFGGSTFNAKGSNRPNYWHMVPRFLTRPRVDPGSLVSESKGVLGFNLIFLTDRAAKLNSQLDELMTCLASPSPPSSPVATASLTPPFVGRIFPFDQAPDALRFLQSGGSVGKVILRVDSTADDQ